MVVISTGRREKNRRRRTTKKKMTKRVMKEITDLHPRVIQEFVDVNTLIWVPDQTVANQILGYSKTKTGRKKEVVSPGNAKTRREEDRRQTVFSDVRPLQLWKLELA